MKSVRTKRPSAMVSGPSLAPRRSARVKLGAGELGAAQVGVAQVAAAEVAAGEVGALQLRALQVEAEEDRSRGATSAGQPARRSGVRMRPEVDRAQVDHRAALAVGIAIGLVLGQHLVERPVVDVDHRRRRAQHVASCRRRRGVAWSRLAPASTARFIEAPERSAPARSAPVRSAPSSTARVSLRAGHHGAGEVGVGEVAGHGDRAGHLGAGQVGAGQDRVVQLARRGARGAGCGSRRACPAGRCGPRAGRSRAARRRRGWRRAGRRRAGRRA